MSVVPILAKVHFKLVLPNILHLSLYAARPEIVYANLVTRGLLQATFTVNHLCSFFSIVHSGIKWAVQLSREVKESAGRKKKSR